MRLETSLRYENTVVLPSYHKTVAVPSYGNAVVLPSNDNMVAVPQGIVENTSWFSKQVGHQQRV